MVPARGRYVLAVVVAQSLVLLSLPLVSRGFTPAEVGVWQYWLTIVGLASSVANLRFDIVIHGTTERDEQAAVLSQGLRVVLVVSPLLTAAFSPLLMGSGSAVVSLSFLLAATVATSSFALLNALALSDGKLRKSGRASLYQGTSTAVLQAAAAIAGGAAYVLMGAVTVGRIAGAAALSMSYRQRASRLVPTVRVRRVVSRVPWSTVWSTLLAQVNLAAPLIVLGKTLGETEFGYVSFSWRIAVLPMSLIGFALAQLITAEVGRSQAATGDGVRHARKWLIYMIPASLAISTVYSVFSLLGVGFVLGEKWVEMTPFMLAWLPFLALQVIASPLSQVLPVLGFRHQHLAVELLRLLLLAAGFALVASIPLSAAETVLVLASFMASGYLLQVLATSIIPIYGKR